MFALLLNKIFPKTLYKCKALSDDLQRTRTVTPCTLFMEVWPFVIIGIIVHSIALKVYRYFHETWFKCTSSSEDVQRTRTVTSYTYTFFKENASVIFRMKIVSAHSI